MYAARNGHVQCVKLFMQAGAGVNGLLVWSHCATRQWKGTSELCECVGKMEMA